MGDFCRSPTPRSASDYVSILVAILVGTFDSLYKEETEQKKSDFRPLDRV